MKSTTETPPAEPHLTIAQTCEVLDVSRWTLNRMRNAREIEFVKADPGVPSSPVLVPVASIRAYLAAQDSSTRQYVTERTSALARLLAEHDRSSS